MFADDETLSRMGKFLLIGNQNIFYFIYVLICNLTVTFLSGKEHALVVCNHRSDIDWLVGWILAQVHDLILVFHASCFKQIWLECISGDPT